MSPLSFTKPSSLLALLASALLMACSGDDDGGAGGRGAGGVGGSGGSGGSADCGAMRDDEALEERISIVVTNERSTHVYLNLGEAYSAFTVDDRASRAVKSPSCQGLLVGRPWIPVELPVDRELAAGALVTICPRSRKGLPAAVGPRAGVIVAALPAPLAACGKKAPLGSLCRADDDCASGRS
ncbi:hypothetical protein [Sorangium sp. So ce1151]|uniref:hypothetical protein n=1 Tax=Sorangium sp. So ce1151 TaxID=3133332 RepID=UPI003F629B58